MGQLAKHSTVAGRYRLGEIIGEGGMARVWRAEDTTLARAVAVKFLFLREDRDRETMVDRFLREARIAAAVRHPNVVDLIDFGTTEEGRPYMVMELLEGESLEQRIQRDPALTLDELVRVMVGALDGLAAVHKAGIVHRDLKPDNVFLQDEGGDIRPKLLDFGVSRDMDPTSGRRSALTTTDGSLVGTPEYMSPEQARGKKDVDWRTDIYSAGAVLYEAMTGQLPYDAEGVGDLIIDIVQGGAPPVVELRPDVGAPLSAVVERAMSIRREDRFQSAREMRDALLDAADRCLGADVRASLPMMAPVRLQREASAPTPAGVPSDVATFDGLELPPPSSAGEPPPDGERSSETPHSWATEAEPPPRRRGSRATLIAAALALPLAGVAGWLVLRNATGPAELTTAASTPSAPTAPEPSSGPAPEAASAEADPGARDEGQADRASDVPDLSDVEGAEPPAAAEDVERAESTEAPADERPAPAAAPAPPVTVTLRGLPRRARVRVDGAEVELEDGAVTLPRDGREHALVVAAPGRRPWRATHRADADGDYRVHLPRRARRRAPEASEPESSEPEPAPQTHQGVFRDLDY